MEPAPFSASIRSDLLRNAATSALDLLIIGGGITGAAVLRDASRRGLRALLVEKDDFAAGTSSRSSKLIHGGLRYLETFDFRLVFEASRERELLLQLAPRLVTSQKFLYPVYQGLGRSLPMVAAGVWLYDVLSLFKSAGHPKILGRRRTLDAEPHLRKEKISGSAIYFDGLTRDAPLTQANLRSAWHSGGIAVNHSEVVDLIYEGSTVTGALVRDHLSHEAHELHATWTVNLTGPWSDLLLEQTDATVRTRLRPTKGVHFVLPKERIPISHAIVMIAPSDGRVTFVIPWEERILVGTTDTDYDGDFEEICATDADVDYLLDTLNFYFPEAHLNPKDVLSTFAGLRPLLLDHNPQPGNVSREHRMFVDQPGLATMTGGKLTTHRKMAEEFLDWLIQKTPDWHQKFKACTTHISPLEEAGSPPTEGQMALEGTNVTWEYLEWAIDHEMATSVSDLLARRTSLVWTDPGHALSIAPALAGRLARKLNLTSDELTRQLQEYMRLAKEADSGLRRHAVKPPL